MNDAPGGSVCRVSGTFGGLVLRCVGGMLCAVLVASGCSDDGSNAVESVTTTFPSTTAVPINTSSPATVPAATTVTPPTSLPAENAAPIPTGAPLSEEQQVFSAIERYYEVLVEANDPPTEDSLLWDDVATPNRAAALRVKAQENLAARRGIRWPENRQPLVHAPSTVLRQDSIAVVDVCLRDNLETYDLDTDAVIDESVSYAWVQLTVTDHFGGWLVSQYRTVQQFESQEPCVASYQ
ncbi:MAG: hypothetical protein F4Y27_06760 [Acidimicrobiaceae bacterium]|nr:hypothetical protein [Acidimicrobiaceae bacterium]MXW62702.1 hypothetical protein [Acidimicrobiaceae bacterium]MXW76726.1 hypothetical protein [Acidimicrobiaceae bacterium]MYA74360.1 hypothetical protein [Acidimicrobiaceae bacterium]MYC41867.1 hypothetical protein [Acidimicrobiaceae bacterium]